MNQPLFKLFVYGSLRSGFHNPAYEYISKYFNLISHAKVKGYLYDLGSYPAAVSTNDDAFIIGELYELNDGANFSWAIEQLDAYEGIEPEDEEAPLYRREVTIVYTKSETTTAWVYWFNGSIENQPKIPSGDIFDFIQQKSKL